MLSPSYIATEAVPDKLPVVVKGDWHSYLRFLEALCFWETPSEENGSHIWSCQVMADRKRAAMRDYLGPQIRSFTRAPKVLTPELVATLGQQNMERRKVKEPYFVRIADLYQQIEHLELELDAKQNELFTLG